MTEQPKQIIKGPPTEPHPLKVLSGNLTHIQHILEKPKAEITEKEFDLMRVGISYSAGLARGLMWRYGIEKINPSEK